MKKSNYEINGQGTDSSPWTSRPASDRIDDYNSTLSDRTGDMYSHNSCPCEIDAADREKRIEELDELIHDKIGDTDKYMKDKNKEQYNIYDNTMINENVSGSVGASVDKNNISNSSLDNSTNRYSSISDDTSDDIEGCGCGVGYMDNEATSNRIDDSGDDWIVERIDVWVDDTADDQTDTGSVYNDQIGDDNRIRQQESNRSNNLKSDTDNGMSCR